MSRQGMFRKAAIQSYVDELDAIGPLPRLRIPNAIVLFTSVGMLLLMAASLFSMRFTVRTSAVTVGNPKTDSGDIELGMADQRAFRSICDRGALWICGPSNVCQSAVLKAPCQEHANCGGSQCRLHLSVPRPETLTYEHLFVCWKESLIDALRGDEP